MGAALLGAGPAFAGGFYLQEQAPVGMGRAMAGEAAIADDPSTVYFNPAGMTKLGKLALSNGSALLSIRSSQRDRGTARTLTATGAATATGGGDGGNPFAPVVPVPALFGAARIGNAPFWLGVSVTAPFGQKVVYDDGWFGRYDSTSSNLKTINVQPSVAWAISDRLSLGAGLDVQWMKAKLSNALPNASPGDPDGLFRVRGDDIAFGWNAGLLADFDTVRLGLDYRSGIDHDLKGSITITGLQGPLAAGNGRVATHSRVRVPDIATVSAVLGAKGSWRLLASASWYNWSVFQDIRIAPATGAARVSVQNYRDTWSASLGAEHDLRPGLTLRAGTMFDQAPTRDAFRTTRVSGGDRFWATAGATVALPHGLKGTLSYAHVFVQDADVARTEHFYAGTAAQTDVTTRSRDGTNIDMVALGISKHF